MKNKKIITALVGIAIIAIILVVAVVLKGNKQIMKAENSTSIVQPATNINNQVVISPSSNDADIDAIESDLNSIPDIDLDKASLSDVELGL